MCVVPKKRPLLCCCLLLLLSCWRSTACTRNPRILTWRYAVVLIHVTAGVAVVAIEYWWLFFCSKKCRPDRGVPLLFVSCLGSVFVQLLCALCALCACQRAAEIRTVQRLSSALHPSAPLIRVARHANDVVDGGCLSGIGRGYRCGAEGCFHASNLPGT